MLIMDMGIGIGIDIVEAVEEADMAALPASDMPAELKGYAEIEIDTSIVCSLLRFESRGDCWRWITCSLLRRCVRNYLGTS